MDLPSSSLGSSQTGATNASICPQTILVNTSKEYQKLIDLCTYMNKKITLTAGVPDVLGDLRIETNLQTYYYRGAETWCNAGHDLVVLLSKPDLQIEELTVEQRNKKLAGYPRNSFLDSFTRCLNEKGDEFRIKAKCFKLDMKTSITQLLQILKYVRPSDVEELTVLWPIPVEIVTTGYWWDGHDSEQSCSVGFPLACFVRFKNYQITMREVLPSDVVYAVQSIIIEKRGAGAGFTIYSSQLINLNKRNIIEFLERFVPLCDTFYDFMNGTIEWRTFYELGTESFIVSVDFSETSSISCKVYQNPLITDDTFIQSTVIRWENSSPSSLI